MVNHEFITDQQLQLALVTQQRVGLRGKSKPLGEILLEQGAITEEQLMIAMIEQLGQHYRRTKPG